MVIAYITAAVVAIILIVTAFERDPMDNAIALSLTPEERDLPWDNHLPLYAECDGYGCPEAGSCDRNSCIAGTPF